MTYIDAQQFLERSAMNPIIDVRSPAEFKQGHIPKAFNIPLFDDEERKRIGILYKNSGREASVLLGLEIVGTKMTGFVKDLKKITPSKVILLHCWRGGMRSNAMAWLFEMGGYNVRVLQGGYKLFRTYIRQKLGEPNNLMVLGGYTGSGKSEILEFIRQSGEQVLNLEKIACHKGSAFGDLGQGEQPTNEQFENNLFFELQKLDLTSVIWVEDESRGIGKVGIPDPFFMKIKESRLVFIDIEKNLRIARLENEFAGFDVSLLESAIRRIKQRLGGQNMKLAIESLHNYDFKTAASVLLDYYDKAYLKGVSEREASKIFRINLFSGEPEMNAKKILEIYNHEIKTNIHQMEKSFPQI